MCDCKITDETTEVCAPCAAMAQKNITELSEYVSGFLTRRFPQGLPESLAGILGEIVLDAFHDGARWAEQQPPAEQDHTADLAAAV